MNTGTRISDVFFLRRRSESFAPPQMTELEDKECTAKTMTDAVKPLLTSMKLFGLYFRSAECQTGSGKVADEKSREKSRRLRWNLCTVYALVVLIFMWINAVRMFSAFTTHDKFGPLLFFKF